MNEYLSANSVFIDFADSLKTGLEAWGHTLCFFALETRLRKAHFTARDSSTGSANFIGKGLVITVPVLASQK